MTNYELDALEHIAQAAARTEGRCPEYTAYLGTFRASVVLRLVRELRAARAVIEAVRYFDQYDDAWPPVRAAIIAYDTLAKEPN